MFAAVSRRKVASWHCAAQTGSLPEWSSLWVGVFSAWVVLASMCFPDPCGQRSQRRRIFAVLWVAVDLMRCGGAVALLVQEVRDHRRVTNLDRQRAAH